MNLIEMNYNNPKMKPMQKPYLSRVLFYYLFQFSLNKILFLRYRERYFLPTRSLISYQL